MSLFYFYVDNTRIHSCMLVSGHWFMYVMTTVSCGIVWTHLADNEWGSSLMSWYTGWCVSYQALVLMVLARTQLFYHDAPEALQAIVIATVSASTILVVAVVVEMRMERVRKKEEVERLKEEKRKIVERMSKEIKRSQSSEVVTKEGTKKERISKSSKNKKDTTNENKPESTQVPLNKSKPTQVPLNKSKSTTTSPPVSPKPPPAPPKAPEPQSPKKSIGKTPTTTPANSPKNLPGKPLSLIDEIKAFNRKELKRREERDKEEKPPDGIYGALSDRLASIRTAVGLGDESEDVELISEEWKD